MGFLDRLLGREPRDQIPGMYQGGGAPRQQYPPAQTPAYGTAPASGSAASTGRSEDEVAIERYRYLLRTAPPDRVEEAHAEAFAQLTPEQRSQVLAQLSETVPPGERATSDDPRDLARMATRAEMRNPGTLERNFGQSRGPGFGSMLGASMLGTIGGMVIGSAVADMMFGSSFGDPSQDFAGGEEGGEAGGAEEAGAEGGDPGAEAGDAGAEPVEAAGAEGGDAGGDAGGGFFGDMFGGGDFGGGDFGGGDFGGEF
ncbi:hypothetical protein ACFQHV_12100 [Promicromonospora thailandica]|uniref:DUF2076 domain-containing protein n=1 Tax=Promicromonospora thailandica TaxID=765201 RepID=A0A9X2JW34_9MICO|nr:hypothetical protein [Promicromonospora thailandica]MCP2265127.1 hypothetical protein [Promicromonospora thailandica]BFF19803.1 hypothetical protein GCM10025730_33240 [Promicromonospora thailandica]